MRQSLVRLSKALYSACSVGMISYRTRAVTVLLVLLSVAFVAANAFESVAMRKNPIIEQNSILTQEPALAITDESTVPQPGSADPQYIDAPLGAEAGQGDQMASKIQERFDDGSALSLADATDRKVDDKHIAAARGGARQGQRGTVVVDPGHGGADIGANRTFVDGFVMKESDLTLQVAQKLAGLLQRDGFTVVLTRNGNTSANNPPIDRTGDRLISTADDLQARIDVANKAEADLFVSIHFNAAASQMGGTEVFYCPDRPFADKSRKMAELLQQNLLQRIRALGYDPADRGVKVDTQSAARTHLYVLGPKTSIIAKPINVPSVLGEALFITNQQEGQLLRDERTLDAIAMAYWQAITQYFAWLGG